MLEQNTPVIGNLMTKSYSPERHGELHNFDIAIIVSNSGFNGNEHILFQNAVENKFNLGVYES